MPKYRLTNQAVADLDGIWNYTADEWSEPQADAYYDMLIDACDRIAAHPNRNTTKSARGFSDAKPGNTSYSICLIRKAMCL